MNTDSSSECKTQSLMKAAWLIAVVTVFSKLIGFIRDVVIANCYGASLVSDSYFYAYQIPALAIVLLGGVGGPFHSATVAVFSKIIPNFNEKAPENVNKLFNTFITASFLVFSVLAVLVFFFAKPIMGIIISAGDPQLVTLAAQHLKIMSPILLFGGLVGIYYGILISYRQFLLPNLSPIVMSLVIISMITLIKGDNTGAVLAWATTIGAFCQFMLQLPKIKQLGFKIKPNLNIAGNAHFRSLCELLFPAILSSTVGQVHIYVDMFFASSLKEGAWTAIGYANRVFQFPVGILVTAFLVPLFPIFSKLVADKNFDDIKMYFNKGVGVLFFGAIPIIIGILVVGMDGVRLLFQRGAFDDNATFMVTEALWFLSFSIVPYVFRDSITRVYYSFNDSATPFAIAFTSIVLKVVMNMLLVDRLGIGGITLSTSLVTLFNACALGMLIHKKIKLDYKSLFKNFGKMCVAGLVSGFICFAGAWLFDKIALPPKIFEVAKILFISILCLSTYVGLNLMLKMEYAVELTERFSSKLRSKIDSFRH